MRFISVSAKPDEPANRCSGYFSGTRRMTMPGVEADSPSPVPDPVGFCSSYIKEAVGPRGHGADAAELLEHGFLVDDLSSVDLEAPQLLPASAATNRLFFQPGYFEPV